MSAALLTALLIAVTPAPSAAPPAAARIVREEARWTSIAPVDELGSGEAGMFLISGEVRNDGGAPLADVRMAYELLADGVVVAREYGYNRRAEALRDPDVESGAVRREDLAIAPLQPGESDLFRMIFLRSSTPRFDTWRVRVDAATPAGGPAATRASAPAPPP